MNTVQKSFRLPCHALPVRFLNGPSQSPFAGAKGDDCSCADVLSGASYFALLRLLGEQKILRRQGHVAYPDLVDQALEPTAHVTGVVTAAQRPDVTLAHVRRGVGRPNAAGQGRRTGRGQAGDCPQAVTFAVQRIDVQLQRRAVAGGRQVIPMVFLDRYRRTRSLVVPSRLVAEDDLELLRWRDGESERGEFRVGADSR